MYSLSLLMDQISPKDNDCSVWGTQHIFSLAIFHILLSPRLILYLARYQAIGNKYHTDTKIRAVFHDNAIRLHATTLIHICFFFLYL